jgi:hypothetical protein
MSIPVMWDVQSARGRFRATSTSQLAEWFATGRVEPTDYVYHPYFQRWMYCRDIEEVVSLAAGLQLDWIAIIHGREYRTQSLEDLKGWWEERRLSAIDSIFDPRQKKWVRAGQLAELAQLPQKALEHTQRTGPQSSGSNSGGWYAPLLIVTVTLVSVFAYFLSQYEQEATKARARQSRPAPVSAPKPPVSLSGEARLSVPGLQQIPLARTKDALNRYNRASAVDDQQEYLNLILGDEMIFVPNGTKVTIIDPGFSVYQVRVLDGSEAGSSGWVPREWVR